MWRLAYNTKAALLKDSNGEYYYIVFDDSQYGFGCYNTQSDDYNALNALRAFEEKFGKATFKHKNLEMY